MVKLIAEQRCLIRGSVTPPHKTALVRDIQTLQLTTHREKNGSTHTKADCDSLNTEYISTPIAAA